MFKTKNVSFPRWGYVKSPSYVVTEKQNTLKVPCCMLICSVDLTLV